MLMGAIDPPDMDDRTKYVREYDRERRKRARRLFHWSLGMPPDEDDMNVQANRFGITWKEIAAVGLLGLGGMGLYQWGQQQPDPPPQPTAQVQPEIEPISGTIRFWTDDGTEIEEAPPGAAK